MSVAQAPSSKKYKLVLLGESGVGKSSLVLRLVKDEWLENQHSTVGASFFRYSCMPDEKTTVNFDIWDTAGQERYKSLASMYYRGSAAALVVYDITSTESIERAKFWIRELKANSPDTVVCLVGNKSDLEQQRKVTPEDGQAYASELGLLFSEASAKDGSKVQKVFEMVAKQLLENSSASQVRDGGVLNANAKKQPGKKKDDCSC